MLTMKFTWFFGVFLFFINLTSLYADASKPPLGTRIYVLDSSSPYQPATIKPLGQARAETFIRDPRMNEQSLSKKVTREPLPPKKTSEITYKPAKLSFSALGISGRISQPRVRFEQNEVEISRVDEVLPSDFIQKVFEVAPSDGI